MANKILFDAMCDFYKQGMAAYDGGNKQAAKELLLKAAGMCNDLAIGAVSIQIRQEYEQKAHNIITFVRNKINSSRQAVTESGGQPGEDKKDAKVGVFSPYKQKNLEQITFDDIIGLDDVKQSIQDIIVMPLKNVATYKKYGLNAGGAVLMYGAPGTGKTMIAKAIASEIKASFYLVSSSEIIDKYLGETEKKIEELFAEVRKNKPAVIFFDEFDSIASRRSEENKVSSAVVPRLLTEINGVGNSLEGILILAATNMPWAIDPAILSRFEQLYLPLPDLVAREGIFTKSLAKDLAKESNLNYNKFAKASDGFSGRDIANVCKKVRQELARQHANSGNEQVCSDDVVIDKINQMSKSISGAAQAVKFEDFYMSAAEY